MSNQAMIFAYAKPSNIGAKSFDGSTWGPSNLAPNNQYVAAGLGDNNGKFTYLTIDPHYPKSVNAFTIIDGINWKASVLPKPQASCIIAVAKNVSSLFYSFDNATFIQGPTTL